MGSCYCNDKRELIQRIKELENQLKIEQEKNKLKCPGCGCRDVPSIKQIYVRECSQCGLNFETDTNENVVS